MKRQLAAACGILIASLGAIPASPALAQFSFYDDASAQYFQYMQGEFQKHRESQLAAVQQAMARPEVQARYRQYRAAGGTESFETYADGYVLTGGYRAEGSRRYLETTSRLGQRDARAIREHFQYEGELQRQTMEQGGALRQRQAEMRGDQLLGEAPYRDHSSGRTHYLPTTLPAGELRFNREGEAYGVDPAGDYSLHDGHDWQPLHYDR